MKPFDDLRKAFDKMFSDMEKPFAEAEVAIDEAMKQLGTEAEKVVTVEEVKEHGVVVKTVTTTIVRRAARQR